MRIATATVLALALLSLGLEPRPPQPRGHEVAVGDFNSLATVVERGIVYRET